VWRERAGMLAGPGRYLQQRLDDRRVARLGGAGTTVAR
jgi:hypothetical protein